MRRTSLSKSKAYELLAKYANTPEVLRHALFLSFVMREQAVLRGHNEEQEYWELAGLLHVLSSATEAGPAGMLTEKVLRAAGVEREMIWSVCTYELDGYTREAAQEYPMECLLVILDHLMLLISAVAAGRPRGSVQGLKVSAVKKKFPDLHFAPDVSRSLIMEGARLLCFEIGAFTSQTMKLMLAHEEEVRDLSEEMLEEPR